MTFEHHAPPKCSSAQKIPLLCVQTIRPCIWSIMAEMLCSPTPWESPCGVGRIALDRRTQKPLPSDRISNRTGCAGSAYFCRLDSRLSAMRHSKFTSSRRTWEGQAVSGYWMHQPFSSSRASFSAKTCKKTSGASSGSSFGSLRGASPLAMRNRPLLSSMTLWQLRMHLPR